MILTNWFICHANISGCPAAKSTGQIISFFHCSLSWIIRQWSRNTCCSSRKGVHTARTIKTVSTPKQEDTSIKIFKLNGFDCIYLQSDNAHYYVNHTDFLKLKGVYKLDQGSWFIIPKPLLIISFKIIFIPQNNSLRN